MVADAFSQAAEARELERLRREDAWEEVEFTEKKLPSEQRRRRRGSRRWSRPFARQKAWGAQRRWRARARTQAAELHRQMVQAWSERHWHAHAAGLMSGSPSFVEGANDDETNPRVPPPPDV